MQPHVKLAMLSELHRQGLLAEAARERQADAVTEPRPSALRARLATALVALALWLDRQAAAAGVNAALVRAS